MNPDLCFEYQQLMLRYNEKNKALNVQQKNTEMRSKNMKQRLDHEEKINKVFENAKSAEKSAEKVETRNTNNGKDKKVNSITENTKSFENKKSLFKTLHQMSKNKNLEKKIDKAPAPEPAPAPAPEPAPEPAPAPEKKKNVKTLLKLISSKHK
jgi:hypothetical protein